MVVDGRALERLGPADLGRLAELCVRCSDFFELIGGEPATEATAAEILGPLAEKVARGTKHVWGLEEGGRLMAVTELLQDYPAAGEWYVGLFLIAPERRRQGLGARICAAIRDWIAGQGGTTLRLVVQPQNGDARRFWEREGFAIEREVMSRTGRLEGAVAVLKASVSVVSV